MTSRRRKIEAAQRLAAGATTEGERQAALAAVERLQSGSPPIDKEDSFQSYLRTGSMDDLADACGPKICDCGNPHPFSTSCPRTDEHQRIREEIRTRFPRGTRCYYNRWAYSKNCAGTVTGYSASWNWVRVKFDHLKTRRSVPVYSAKGWHLFTSPVPDADLRKMDIRGGAEKMEDMSAAIQNMATSYGRASKEFQQFADALVDTLFP